MRKITKTTKTKLIKIRNKNRKRDHKGTISILRALKFSVKRRKKPNVEKNSLICKAKIEVKHLIIEDVLKCKQTFYTL